MILKDKTREILGSIIDYYLKNGEAVGSKTLVKSYNIDYSTATVRNVMSELEEFGYIKKEHTSSGRVPTSKGYKLYIDDILELKELTRRERDEIKKKYVKSYDEELVKGPEVLSGITNYTSFGLESSTLNEKLNKIELVYVNERSFLAVIVTDVSVRTKRMIVNNVVKEDELKALSNYLNNMFLGRSLKDIAIIDETPLNNEFMLLQSFINEIENRAHISKSESIMSYMAQNNRFNVDRYKMFQANEEVKEFLNKLVKKGIDTKRVNIILGEELNEELEDLSFVFSTYKKGKGRGMLGIVGPKRMEYSKMASVVSSVAKRLERGEDV